MRARHWLGSWPLLLALLGALAGCGGGHLGPDASCDDPDASAETCGPCSPVTVDGVFTRWSADAPTRHEWSCALVQPGVYGVMHVRYDQGALHFLNDWLVETEGPVCARCFNQFFLQVGEGVDTRLFEIRVFGDQSVRAWQDGQDVTDRVRGGAGFDVSPNEPDVPHAIFEFRLDLPLSGTTAFTMKEKDPENATTGDDEDELLEEPVILKGTLDPGGSIGAEGVEGLPIAERLEPWEAYPGDPVTIRGSGFGEVEGAVYAGTTRVEVTAWTDRSIRFRAPDEDPGLYLVRVVAQAGATAGLGLRILCPPRCEGRTCGDDGCGGQCGACSGGDVCRSGLCCTPACAGRECGPDGCGGQCGSCADDEACQAGRCACVPACEGRTCGPDGCGGVCGTCGADQVCQEGSCCVRGCAGKTCGPDACGGSCGACGGAFQCQEGLCVCVPACQGKACGDDGCGGSCGACGEGEMCAQGACVCAPACAGKACGDDGCGGSCGACGPDEECAKNGQCQPIP